MERRFIPTVMGRAREIASTPGWARRAAVSAGMALGAAFFAARLGQGWAPAAAAMSGIGWAILGVPLAVWAIAQNQVMWRAGGEPMPERSPAAAMANVHTMNVASVVMAVAALSLSILALLK